MSQIELDRYDSRPIRALGKCEIMMFGFKGLLHSPKIPFLIKILALRLRAVARALCARL
jgi:hypothetical protein